MDSPALAQRVENPGASSPRSIEKGHTRGRTNVTQACTQCRQRRIRVGLSHFPARLSNRLCILKLTIRIKCGGEQPRCSICDETALDCKYEVGTDRRTSQYKQRRSEEMQRQLAQYKLVFDRLQNGSQDTALRLLTELRLSGLSGVTDLIRSEQLTSMKSLVELLSNGVSQPKISKITSPEMVTKTVPGTMSV